MAARIRSARLQRGFSQKQLADLLEVGRSTVAHWERATGFSPSTSHLNKLSGALDVSIEWLAFGTALEAKPVAINRIVRRADVEARLLELSRHFPVAILTMLISLLEGIGEVGP